MGTYKRQPKPVKGKYQFLMNGVILLLLLVGVVLLSISYISITYKDHTHDLRVQEQQKAWYARNAFTARNEMILKEIQFLATDPDIIHFANLNTSYAYETVAAFQKLIQFTTLFSTDSYDLAITSSWDQAKVLTTEGSKDKFAYYQNTLQLTSEQIQQIQDFSADSQEKQVRIVKYDAKGNLAEILHFIKRSTHNNSIVFIAQLQPKFFYETEIPSTFIIYDRSGEELARSTLNHNINPHTEALIASTIQNNSNSDFSVFVNISNNPSESLSIYTLPQSNLIMAIISANSMNTWLFRIGVLIILLPFVILGLIYLSKRLSRKLYQPIEMVMTSFEDVDSGQRPSTRVDELAVVHTRMQKIQNLRLELEQLTQENVRYFDQEILLGLINGFLPNHAKEAPIMHLLENSPYRTIVLLLNQEKMEDALLIFQQVESLNQQEVPTRALAIESNRFLFVIFGSDLSKAEAEFMRIMGSIASLPAWNAAISQVYQGAENVRISYNECAEILEYRYLQAENTLLNISHLPADRSTFYFYPIQTERLFSRLLIAGEAEALAVFDKIIRENFEERQLADEVLAELMQALANTIARCLQEMKIDTNAVGALADRSLQDIVQNWHSKSALVELRAYIEDVLALSKFPGETQEQQQLLRMQEFIALSYKDDIMLQDLADHMGLHPKYCSALFGKLASTNFKEYLNTYRINKAIQIMQAKPNIKIAALAGEVGFNSASSFIRAFKQVTGTTPGQYKES